MKQAKMLLLLLIGLGLIIGLDIVKSQLSVLYTFGPEDSELSRAIYVMENKLTDKLICNVDTDGKKLVALSFDDGPDPLYTPGVLEILKRYQIKATFFVVGESVEAQPGLVKREIEEGHEIENHTYSHPDLRSENDLKTEEEIFKTGQLIENMSGTKGHFFRPPRRLYRKETIEIAERNGYQTVLWTICVENSKAKTPEDMAKRVINAARPGMIILAHDGRLDRNPTLAALPMIIEGLQELGYEFVTLDKLISARVEN